MKYELKKQSDMTNVELIGYNSVSKNSAIHQLINIGLDQKNMSMMRNDIESIESSLWSLMALSCDPDDNLETVKSMIDQIDRCVHDFKKKCEDIRKSIKEDKE